MISIITPHEIQILLAESHQVKRKWMKHSRSHAAKLTGVPEATIRKFENTGEISLRQFMMLCIIYGDLAQHEDSFPIPKAKTIQELISIESKSGKA